MPNNIGQWTSMAMTAIIVFGCDLDVAYAMPLGILAGILATFFAALAESHIAGPAESRIGIRN